MEEFIVFGSFVVIQVLAKQLPEWMAHSNKCKAIAERAAKHHYLVWAAHPAVVEAIHEYVVHIVVYSGYVIRAH